jgi:anti-anti-sigma regulatory factor
MNISTSQVQGKVAVSVITLEGQLDGQSYHDLIVKTREVYDAGGRDFVIDMAGLTYISSAGLVALHSMALLVRGEELPNPEAGWSAFKPMSRASEADKQAHMKLLNPRPEVQGVLEMVGFTVVFDIFSRLEDAVKSF